MLKISPLSLVRNGQRQSFRPTVEQLRDETQRACAEAVRWVETRASCSDELSFRDVERELREAVFAVGRALVVLFLALREQQLVEQDGGLRLQWLGRRFRPAPAIARNLSTMFGVVSYWRIYLREVAPGARHGLHPLDLSLGLTQERFSWNVLMHAARLSAELSYATARSVLSDFVPHPPSTEVIEQSMLGLGAHTEAWFRLQPAPQDDGEVLVVEIDAKGVPTATCRELRRRRGKRTKRAGGGSPRHRGRLKRARHPKQPRRRKGDKAKNAKMVTMVVMYTLRRVGTRRLEGPVHRRHYASFGSKQRAFEIARREADKRGFGREQGRRVQLLTDGDNDYARLASQYFPEAMHTVDCYHVFEKLWEAGTAFCKEGSAALRAWVAEQKQHLFDDEPEAVLAELVKRRDAIAPTGPGNKGRRQRLRDAWTYLNKRMDKIRYGRLRRRDLAISTGIVEGALKHIVARRCDHGGMRWIPERAQAVVQLRCIVVNGDWEAFDNFVHERLRAAAHLNAAPERIQTQIPQQLPEAA